MLIYVALETWHDYLAALNLRKVSSVSWKKSVSSSAFIRFSMHCVNIQPPFTAVSSNISWVVGIWVYIIWFAACSLRSISLLHLWRKEKINFTTAIIKQSFVLKAYRVHSEIIIIRWRVLNTLCLNTTQVIFFPPQAISCTLHVVCIVKTDAFWDHKSCTAVR